MTLCLRDDEAIDEDTARVGPQIAEKLGGSPGFTCVERHHILSMAKGVTVRRQLEDGYEVIRDARALSAYRCIQRNWTNRDI
ncbi:MAG: hypothetical protein ACLTBV_26735 [Enterocloster bolteae]